MKKLATIIFCMLSFGISSSAQDPNEIKLANYKMKINNLQVESVEVVLSKEIEISFWNNDLIEHLEQGMLTASKKKSKSKFKLYNLVVYFSALDVELNPSFKGYGKGKAIFYFYLREGEKLVKIKSVKTEAETKLKYLPRLLLEKAIGDVDIKEVGESLRVHKRIDRLQDEIVKIEKQFSPNYETQKPGVYLFFEDVKSNEPIRTLSDEEFAYLTPERNYLSVFINKDLNNKNNQSSSIISNYWGIFTGTEYLALIDNFLVKLHQKEGNFVFPAYALDIQVVNNPPARVHLSRALYVLSMDPIGLVGAGVSAAVAARRRNKPSFEKKVYVLNNKYGHFNFFEESPE